MSPLPTAPAHLSTQDARLRAAYLRELLGTLYPGSGDGTGDTEFLVLPTASRPRLLVPAGARTGRAAAAAVRHATEPRSGQARAVRVLAAAALRTGAARLPLPFLDRVRVPAAGSLQAHLRELLGSPLALAIHVGPARANRKPVLQLLDPAGSLVGFAKLGTTGLTRRLIRAEAAALTALSQVRLRQVTVPTAWYAGQWRGHQLLVQSALPVWRPRAGLHPERLALAMREVAECCGTGAGPLAASRYWQRLSDRVSALVDQPEGRTLAGAASTLLARSGQAELRYGAWHGDWSPWNMATLPGTLLLWDWERFTTDVPLGFDAVHYHLQELLATGPDAAAAVRSTLDAAGRLLAPFAVPPAARELTALLYLVDLAARYLADRQAAAGARLGVLGTWLLPVLVARLQEVS